MKKKYDIVDDPFAKRELTKYDNPIPSREYIMQVMRDIDHPVSRRQLINAFDLADSDQRAALKFRLKAMLRDGQIVEDRRFRYCLPDKIELIPGRVIAHPDSFGFVTPDVAGEDLYLSPREMRKVLHGDRVMARVIGRDRRGRLEGAIMEVIEHKTEQLVGRFFEDKGVAFVEPDNKRFPRDIHIPTDKTAGAKSGQIVMVSLLTQPSERSRIIGEVTEILGAHMAPGMEIEVAIRSYDLPHTWEPTVEQDAARLPEEVIVDEQLLSGRNDIRELPLVTIDGADARDFDDAVYCKPRPKGGWILYVAIADVSHYVTPESALDISAQERGNSVYFPQQVLPMLPEKLSNGLCSLMPDVDRLCMVCEMAISAKGKVERSRFYPAVMHSHARLTYSDVAAMLIDGDADLIAKYQVLFPHLQALYDLYKVLHKQRQVRGALELDTTETRIVFGEERKIEQIVPVVRNDAHRLIEECMLLANVCAAEHLQKAKIPALYRVHEPPSDEKLSALRSFLTELALDLKGGESPSPKDYGDLLARVEDRPDKHIIHTVVLRSLSQAQYHAENVGHFGLAFEAYTHFTSPIRRYPDLLVHRAIKHVLSHKPVSEFYYGEGHIEHFGEHCSMTERRADEATRDVVNWLKCEYMQDKIGEEYAGIISGVTSFGIFVELLDTYVDGLVHITELKNDYYQYDSEHHRLRGERSGKTYRLGDKVKIKVMRVDLDNRKIDFSLLK